MLIAEELLLLCLDDASGRKALSGSSLRPALGAALLVDLALRERIDVAPAEAGWAKRGRVQVINVAPTDDAELDQVLDHLSRHPDVKVSHLVSDSSSKRITKKLDERLLARLVDGGVLAEERSAVLGLRSWPVRDPQPELEVRQRLQGVLVHGLTPTEPTVALISLLQAIGRLVKVATESGPVDKRQVRARAKELSEGDWAAKAVKDAVAEAATIVAVTAGAAAASSS